MATNSPSDTLRLTLSRMSLRVAPSPYDLDTPLSSRIGVMRLPSTLAREAEGGLQGEHDAV